MVYDDFSPVQFCVDMFITMILWACWIKLYKGLKYMKRMDSIYQQRGDKVTGVVLSKRIEMGTQSNGHARRKKLILQAQYTVDDDIVTRDFELSQVVYDHFQPNNPVEILHLKKYKGDPRISKVDIQSFCTSELKKTTYACTIIVSIFVILMIVLAFIRFTGVNSILGIGFGFFFGTLWGRKLHLKDQVLFWTPTGSISKINNGGFQTQPQTTLAMPPPSNGQVPPTQPFNPQGYAQSQGYVQPQGYSQPQGYAPPQGGQVQGYPQGYAPVQGQQPMMGQPMTGQPMTGQSMMGQPMTGQPMTGQPMTGQPMMGQPMMGQPMMGQPMMGQPMMGQPMMGQPMMGQATAPPANNAGPPSYDAPPTYNASLGFDETKNSLDAPKKIL